MTKKQAANIIASIKLKLQDGRSFTGRADAINRVSRLLDMTKNHRFSEGELLVLVKEAEAELNRERVNMGQKKREFNEKQLRLF